MMIKSILTLTLLTSFLLAFGCSGGVSDKTKAENLLPQKLPSGNLVRTSDVDVYVGETLSQYLGDDAGIYQTYGFVELAVADYTAGEVELTIEVYRFDTRANAEDLFDVISPSEGKVMDTGGRGVVSQDNVFMVKENYLINVDTYDESTAAVPALAWAASAIAASVPVSEE